MQLDPVNWEIHPKWCHRPKFSKGSILKPFHDMGNASFRDMNEVNERNISKYNSEQP